VHFVCSYLVFNDKLIGKVYAEYNALDHTSMLCKKRKSSCLPVVQQSI
jgi:hypothetical protein